MSARTWLFIGFAVVAAGVGGFVLATYLRPTPDLSPKDPSPTLPAPKEQAPISDDALARMKAATVFLEVENASGMVASGTGWFGFAENHIVTNAHVVGLLNSGSQPPKRITAFVHPGVTGKQIELVHAKLRVLAVDRDMDLAVIEVLNPASPLPAPLPIRASATLKELEPLVVLGFPGGRRIAEKTRRTDAPAVSVSSSVVSGLRRDAHDALFAVQVQGGIVHGHSGGPVCDLDGNCVAVAVRVDLDHNSRLTGIGYGVPTEFVTGLMAGRLAGTEVGYPYSHEGKVRLPFAVNSVDPRKVLKAVGVVAWVGNAEDAPRPPGSARPPAAPGDADEFELPLRYDAATQRAVGELAFPVLPAGRAYWVQPFLTDSTGEMRFVTATRLELPGLPVMREPAELTFRPAMNGKRSVSVRRTVELTDAEGWESSGLSRRLRYEADAAFTETTAKGGRTWTADSLTVWRDHYGRREDAPEKLLERIKQALPAVTTAGEMSATGELTQVKLDAKNADRAAVLAPFAGVLQSAAVRLPNKTVEPLATWTTVREVRWALATAGFDDATDLPTADTLLREELTFTHVGSRDGQAVVVVNGVVKPVAGAAVAVSGTLSGQATIDPATGDVSTADLRRAFELGTTNATGPARRWSGTETVVLRRGGGE